jgi:hypothetical protein
VASDRHGAGNPVGSDDVELRTTTTISWTTLAEGKVELRVKAVINWTMLDLRRIDNLPQVNVWDRPRLGRLDLKDAKRGHLPQLLESRRLLAATRAASFILAGTVASTANSVGRAGYCSGDRVIGDGDQASGAV